MACQLDTDSKAFRFVWILENFKYSWHKKMKPIRSPTFIVDTIERSKWSMDIYPRGQESESCISLFLCREIESKGSAIIKIDFELAFITPDGKVLTSDIEYGYGFRRGHSRGFPDFEERESVCAEQSKFLTQGALTIMCRIWWSNRKITVEKQFIARTHIGVERNFFYWRIKNFSSFAVGQENIFRLNSTLDDKPIITLKLFLRRSHSSYNIFIRFVNFHENSALSTFKSSLVNAQGDYVNCGTHEFLLSSTVESVECMLSLSKNTLVNDSTLYLPNDSLTLCCEYAFSSGAMYGRIEATTCDSSNWVIKTNAIPKIINTDSVAKLDSDISTDLKTDLHSLLQDNILCDVKLCAASETFPAHWIILSARSPVFRAMFKSDMKEKAKDRIDIKDLKPDTIRRMLVYLYTDSLEELQWESASDLYVAAEKYQIISLKKKCSSFLKTNLNFTNACEVLLLADLHQDKELKSITQDFILENDKDIINSSEWKFLMETNVQLAAETMVLRYK